MKSRRAILVEPEKFEIREVEVNPGPGDLLVKVGVNGLCNWELNHFKGLLGECPQSLGHEWAGTVAAVGKYVNDFTVGDHVTSLEGGMTGFSDYLTAPVAKCFKLVKDVELEHGLVEPLKCIVTVLRGTAPEVGDYGVVLGCGPMGLWCIQALSGNLLGGLIAVDVDESKLKLAEKFGATHMINSRAEDTVRKIREITGGHMADFVIEGTGIPAVLNTGLSYLRNNGRGRLILMSSHEEICKEFDFREAIKRSVEIRVPHPGYSMNQTDDMRRAVNALNRGVFKMDEIISHRFKLEDIQKAFETLEQKPKGYIKGVVIP